MTTGSPYVSSLGGVVVKLRSKFKKSVLFGSVDRVLNYCVSAILIYIICMPINIYIHLDSIKEGMSNEEKRENFLSISNNFINLYDNLINDMINLEKEIPLNFESERKQDTNIFTTFIKLNISEMEESRKRFNYLLEVTTLQNNLKQALDDVKNLEEQLTAAQAEVKALEKKVVKSKAVKPKTTKSGTKK